MNERSWTTTSEAETEAVGAEIAELLETDGLLLLDGDLGVGKTVLVRGLAQTLGIGPREVQSPSYTLIHDHDGAAGRLIHVDLYRLDVDDVPGLGLDDLIAGPGVKAIEWPDRLPAHLVDPALAHRVHLAVEPGGERRITLHPIVDV
ncbi:MAG: tRNA (adenosine(37)-N6)-threonylcarbamoyltransferase complex ATPase subunit type 1 TsaE [Acidobacteriota bacterium]